MDRKVWDKVDRCFDDYRPMLYVQTPTLTLVLPHILSLTWLRVQAWIVYDFCAQWLDLVLRITHLPSRMLKSLRRCNTITGQYENDSTSSLWRSCICNRSLYVFLLSKRLYVMVLNAISIPISTLNFEKGRIIQSKYNPQWSSSMMCKRALGFQMSTKFCIH